MSKIKYPAIIFAIIILAACTSIVSAESNWNLKVDRIIVDTEIIGSVNITNPEKIKFMDVIINYYPEDNHRQKKLVENFFPEKNLEEIKHNSVIFKFSDIRADYLEYGVYSRVEAKNEIYEVSHKINFPLLDVPEDEKIYTKPTEIIDSDNAEIITLAQTISAGEDDLYMIVVNIAEWVANNVEYNPGLSETDKTASWVLRHKEGVCKENTNLFIALLRSLGIPARFISGTAYTNMLDNIEQNEGWSPHAWTEVYFPTIGWVPFDTTYRQYSFVDATHIKLTTAADGKENRISYKWQDTGSEIEINPITSKTSLIETFGEINGRIDVALSLAEQTIGFGSFNLIELEITNNRDAYVTPIFYIAEMSDATILGSNSQTITLKPKESKKIYWIIRINAGLNKDFIYTMPVEIRSNFNTISSSQFKAKEGSVIYTIEDMEERISRTTDVAGNVNKLENVVTTCSITNKIIEVGDEAEIVCTISNEKEDQVEGINICSDNHCRIVKLESKEKAAISFKKIIKQGITYHPITVSIKEETKNVFVMIPLRQVPELSINVIDYPRRVNYTDSFQVAFKIEKETKIPPKDVLLTVFMPFESKQLSIPDLDKQEEIILTLSGYDLKEGQNKITFRVTYKDSQDKKYEYVKDITIRLNKPTLYQKIKIFFKSIRNLFA
jgi:hypothetical protein